ncbi:MAG: hypothetical protein AAF693_20765 [Bacteroidota bacterium]
MTKAGVFTNIKTIFYWYYDSCTDDSIIEKHGYPTWVAEWIEEIDWTNTDDTKTIPEHTVQKATRESLDFVVDEQWKKGDNTAGCALDLPLSTEPESYYKLYSFILELSNTKSSDKFTLKEISFSEELEAIPYTGGISATKGEILNPYHGIDKKWLKIERKRINIEVN